MHRQYVYAIQFYYIFCADEPSLLISEQYELLNWVCGAPVFKPSSHQDGKAIFSLDYDRREQKVYWVSLEEESIKYAFHGIKVNSGTIVKGKNKEIKVDTLYIKIIVFLFKTFFFLCMLNFHFKKTINNVIHILGQSLKLTKKFENPCSNKTILHDQV